MRYFLLGVYLFLILGCRERQGISELEIKKDDLEMMKEAIWVNFTRLDSHHFSDEQICFFQSYLESDFYKTDPTYDLIYKGFLIKYFFCPYINFSFTVLKGTDEKIYYVGLSDLVYFEKLADGMYERDSGHLIKLTSSSPMVEIESAVAKTLNQVFSSDPFFKKFGNTETDQIEKLGTAYSLAFSCYKKPEPGYKSVHESIFDSRIIPEDLWDALANLQILKGDSTGLKIIYDQVHPLTYKYLDRIAIPYYLENRGIVVFNFVINGDRLIMSETLIPQGVRKLEFKSDLSYNLLFPDC